MNYPFLGTPSLGNPHIGFVINLFDSHPPCPPSKGEKETWAFREARSITTSSNQIVAFDPLPYVP